MKKKNIAIIVTLCLVLLITVGFVGCNAEKASEKSPTASKAVAGTEPKADTSKTAHKDKAKATEKESVSALVETSENSDSDKQADSTEKPKEQTKKAKASKQKSTTAPARAAVSDEVRSSSGNTPKAPAQVTQEPAERIPTPIPLEKLFAGSSKSQVTPTPTKKPETPAASDTKQGQHTHKWVASSYQLPGYYEKRSVPYQEEVTVPDYKEWCDNVCNKCGAVFAVNDPCGYQHEKDTGCNGSWSTIPRIDRSVIVGHHTEIQTVYHDEMVCVEEPKNVPCRKCSECGLYENSGFYSTNPSQGWTPKDPTL